MKKACSVDQYGASPMDGSKDGQAGAPAAVPVRAPVTAAVAQGVAAPTSVPTGAPTTSAVAQGSACRGGCLQHPRQCLRGRVTAAPIAVSTGRQQQRQRLRGRRRPRWDQRGRSHRLRGREGRPEGGQRRYPRQFLRGHQRQLQRSRRRHMPITLCDAAAFQNIFLCEFTC
jgi:hypothetical protein